MEETNARKTGTGLQELDAAEDLKAILAAERRVLLDFSAEWCGPCQLMEPVLEEVNGAVGAPVVKIDVEAHPVIAAEYDVNAVPTYVVIEDGEAVETLVGAQNKELLVEKLTR